MSVREVLNKVYENFMGEVASHWDTVKNAHKTRMQSLQNELFSNNTVHVVVSFTQLPHPRLWTIEPFEDVPLITNHDTVTCLPALYNFTSL